jgi:hypothetical protein
VNTARDQATQRKHVGSYMENLQRPNFSKARREEVTQHLTIKKLRYTLTHLFFAKNKWRLFKNSFSKPC